MQSFSPFKRFIQQCSLFVVFICCGILFMSCSSSGGSSSSSTTSGTVVDPPISGATVFCDTNGNFVLDDGELRTTSDENGEYLLSDTCPKGTSVVAIGGIDTVTGEENVLLSKECMTDSGDCGMITPFSSIYDLTPPENRENLVANYFGDGITPDQALNTDFHKTCEQSGDSDSDHCKMYQKNMEIAVILSGALTAMDESLSGSGITDTVAMKHVFAGISEKIMDHDDSSSNFEFDETEIKNVLDETCGLVQSEFSDFECRESSEFTNVAKGLEGLKDTMNDWNFHDTQDWHEKAEDHKHYGEVVENIIDGTYTDRELENMDYSCLDKNDNGECDRLERSTGSNEAPVIAELSGINVTENSYNLHVGTIVATDADNDEIEYFLDNSGDSSYFEIYPHQIENGDFVGYLYLKNPADFESKAIYNLTVVVFDGVWEVTRDIVVNVIDVDNEATDASSNSAPYFNYDGYSVNESDIVYVDIMTEAIATIDVTDDESDTLFYSIIEDIKGIFVIHPYNGELYIYDHHIKVSDAEQTVTYSIVVKVTDEHGASVTDNIFIYVQDDAAADYDVSSNTPPTFTSSHVFTVTENITQVGTISATDSDGHEVHYFIDRDIGDGSYFYINHLTGVLKFKTAPTYSDKNGVTYNVTIVATDPYSVVTENIEIMVVQSTDAGSDTTNQIVFNVSDGNYVVSVGGVTLSGNNPYIPVSLNTTYNIINNAYSAHPLKFENHQCREDSDCPPAISHNDPSQLIVNNMTISGLDYVSTNDQDMYGQFYDIAKPHLTSDEMYMVTAGDTAVGTVNAIYTALSGGAYSDISSNLRYSVHNVDGSSDADRFSIDSNTGVLTFKAASVVGTYNIIVKATDSNDTSNPKAHDGEIIQIFVTAANDGGGVAPTGTNIVFNVSDGNYVVSVGGVTLSGNNPYIPVSLNTTYNITNNAPIAHPLKIENHQCRGDANCSDTFELNPATLVVNNTTISGLDYICDVHSSMYGQFYDIAKPHLTSDEMYMVTAGDTAVGTVTAIYTALSGGAYSDISSNLRYSVHNEDGSSDADRFSIDQITGVLTFKAASVVGTYNIIVKATDPNDTSTPKAHDGEIIQIIVNNPPAN